MQLRDTEFMVMRVLWRGGAWSAAEIRRIDLCLTQYGVRSALKSLEESRYIKKISTNKKPLYSALITEKQYAVRFLAYCECTEKEQKQFTNGWMK